MRGIKNRPEHPAFGIFILSNCLDLLILCKIPNGFPVFHIAVTRSVIIPDMIAYIQRILPLISSDRFFQRDAIQSHSIEIDRIRIPVKQSTAQAVILLFKPVPKRNRCITPVFFYIRHDPLQVINGQNIILLYLKIICRDMLCAYW